MGEKVAFYILSVFMVLGSLGVVLSKNLFRSALFLAMVLFTTAGFYLLLKAEILAAIQVLLYTGGVITLLVFAIMLTGKLAGETISQTNRGIFVGVLAGLLVFITLMSFFSGSYLLPSVSPMVEKVTFQLSRLLFNKHVLAFEVLSVLLVGAIVGALTLSRREV
jgi:NADH:ubiquinone oxidoreductase subunit 6 (subunit J)